MLIYNSIKEFVGIDEKDLNLLGFQNLQELQKEVLDFADMFLKKPGFVHNFQHVNWIDFIQCSDSEDNTKVIIKTNQAYFRCNILIENIYLTQDPDLVAYSITLHNLVESNEEGEGQKMLQIITPQTPNLTKSIIAEIPRTSTTSSSKFEIEEQEISKDSPLELDFDDNMYNQHYEDSLHIEAPVEAPVEAAIEAATSLLKPKDVNLDSDIYIYNPIIASEELGLPVDLIEEFIEDFIAQAKEFKENLYIASDKHDLNNVKILSHKLKGVAANLRIEDAFESLRIINIENEQTIIQKELDTFYQIIAKLSGQTIDIPQEPLLKEINTKEQEVLEVINDSDVPIKIDLPELADDDFFLQINEDEETFSGSSISYSKLAVANEIGIDEESFNELFKDYLNESMLITQNIKDAILNENRDQWQKETLKLKGMSENMRIENLTSDFEILIKTDETNLAQISYDNIVLTLETLINEEG